MRRPVNLAKRKGAQQFAIGAVYDVEEAVAVGVQDHLAQRAVDVDVGDHVFVHTVIVE